MNYELSSVQLLLWFSAPHDVQMKTPSLEELVQALHLLIHCYGSISLGQSRVNLQSWGAFSALALVKLAGSHGGFSSKSWKHTI